MRTRRIDIDPADRRPGRPRRLARTASAAAALACVWSTVGSSVASADLTDDVGALVDANVTGGTTGFRLTRGDGALLANRNPDYVAYPASCIKVSIHLHAMRVVEVPNQIHLNTLVPVYLNGDDSCSDDHGTQVPTNEPLGDVLREMMEDSDNDRTNAAIDFFGLTSINITAHNVVGMSNATWIVNKFGSPCGGPGQDPANSFTLRDIHRVYERVAAGEIFALDQTRDDFYDLMLNSPTWLEDLIDAEAPAGLDPGDLATFKAGVELARKGGSWTTGGGIVYRTLAGWVKLPAPPCPTGGGDRHYAFSTFFDQATGVSAGFDTKDVVEALLREEVRRTLEDWRDCLDPDFTIACLGIGCPCGNDDPAAGCRNSTGSGGVLSASGSRSVAADDLVLNASSLPPLNNGLFYMGDTLVSNPFFDGIQCALGTTFRFLGSVQNSGTTGTMSYTRLVAESGGMILPGSTWYFHCWFRDVGGPSPGPCGSGANLTHVLGVVFAP